jgi:C-terminal processing protease CtpA/Prc
VLTLFDRALGDAPREGPRHRGLILDLRETARASGGADQGHAILSRLIERPFLAARRRTPLHSVDSLVWLSEAPDTIWPPLKREGIAYTGPVVVLCSPRTIGAAEDFLVAFRAGGRGPIIGESSAGGAGQTAQLPLAAGWKLRLTVSRDAFPDGKEFIRTGIAPDIPVEVRVEDVLAGRDAVLDRARAYLSETVRR